MPFDGGNGLMMQPGEVHLVEVFMYLMVLMAVLICTINAAQLFGIILQGQIVYVYN